MTIRRIGPCDRPLRAIGALAATLLIAAGCETAQTGTQTSLAQAGTLISSQNQCAERGMRAPTAAELAESGARARFTAIAEACWSPVSATTGIDPAGANRAFNAAQIFAALAETQPEANAGIANALYAKAAAAAARSRTALGDGDSRLVSSNDAAGQANTRFKFSRMAILADAYAALGQTSDGAPASTCGGRATCLERAVSLADQATANPAGLAGAISPRARDSLQLTRATAIGRLGEMGRPVDTDDAIDDLEAIVQRHAASSDPAARRLAMKARDALITQARNAAGQTLASTRRSRSDLNRAIGFLEQADDTAQLLPGRSGEIAATRQLLGEALMVRAGLTGPGSGPDTARADFCSAAAAYRRSAEAARAAGETENAARAREGQGLALSKLEDESARLCPDGIAGMASTTREAAIAALEDARALRGSLNAEPGLALALLYRDAGRISEARALENELDLGSTPTGADSARRLVELARLDMPRDDMSAARIRSICSGSQSRIANRLRKARTADPASPLPDLELGKLGYFCGGDTNARRMAENDLKSALRKARAQSGGADVRAEANHFLSLGALADAYQARGISGRAAQAASWAETAVNLDPSVPDYRHQACRARLMTPRERERMGTASAHCSAHTDTPEGALLNAMKELRAGQIERIKRPGASVTAFQSALEAFRAARATAETRSDTRGSRDRAVRWPGMAESISYRRLIDTGRFVARYCGTPRAEADSLDRPDDPASQALFEEYRLSRCDKI